MAEILLAALLLVLSPKMTPTVTSTNEKGQNSVSQSSATNRTASISFKKQRSGGFSKVFFVRGVHFSLGAAVILGCMEAHRMVGPVVLYLATTALLLYTGSTIE